MCIYDICLTAYLFQIIRYACLKLTTHLTIFKWFFHRSKYIDVEYCLFTYTFTCWQIDCVSLNKKELTCLSIIYFGLPTPPPPKSALATTSVQSLLSSIMTAHWPIFISPLNWRWTSPFKKISKLTTTIIFSQYAY